MPIKKAISFIEQNLDQQITFGEIAHVAGLSPYYFARLFRSATGKTTMGYLRHRRLTEAAKILESNQDTSLIHLALDYGFDSQEAFNLNSEIFKTIKEKRSVNRAFFFYKFYF